jgi:hypothetical protein
MLESIIEFIKSNPRECIRLQGGEFSDIELYGIEPKWLKFIAELIVNNVNEVTFVSSLMGGRYSMLEKAIDMLSCACVTVSIYVSWDLYRDSFSSFTARVNAFKEIHPDVNINYSITLNNELMKSFINNEFPIALNDRSVVNLPSAIITDGTFDEAKAFTENAVPDLFLNRELFLGWISRLVNEKKFQFIFNLLTTGYLNDSVVFNKDAASYIPKNEQVGVSPCGHSNMFKVYAGSDACCVCDILNLIE